ncbi:MAG: transketolase [Synergistaceae bacterium]|nr:transketolase [Synergistaceae bacterium]
MLLTNEKLTWLKAAAKQARINSVTMVQAANSGHPAGAFSSIEMILGVYTYADVTPENCSSLDRDYIVVSHGHVSSGVYAALGEIGFIDSREAVINFRKLHSVFQGHIVREVPGIDWGTGNLGQGLSAGVGYALAQRARGYDGRVFVLMGDGAQTKGQLAESRRVAVKENLSNITALIDLNDIQICGKTNDIMPCNVKELWEADGWKVFECDGHSFEEIFDCLDKADKDTKPAVIICKTLMGKDGLKMEGTEEFHGKATGLELCEEIVASLGGEKDMPEKVLELRKNSTPKDKGRKISPIVPSLDMGEKFVYAPDVKTDNRGAFGKVLSQVGELNYKKPGKTPILVFDCDLSPSVQTKKFSELCPENFVQCGIQEHATATISGAAAAGGTVSVWADFGVFGIDEVYNQHRLNDINNAGNKLILTHTGLDVGEDGSTHQCIDYIGLMNNMYGWKLIVPADPNQTDRATRWLLKTPGCMCMAMGRSKVPVIPEFANENFEFEYGKAIKLREGDKAAVFALGYMTSTALKAADELAAQGIKISVYSVSCPLAPDMDAIKEAAKTNAIITIEDHNVNTGMAAIMAVSMMKEGVSARFKNIGVAHYGPSGSADDVRKFMGLSVDNLVKTVKEIL